MIGLEYEIPVKHEKDRRRLVSGVDLGIAQGA
jgi:hypothetical protein